VLARAEHELVRSGALTAERAAWRMPTAGEITQPFGPTDVWFEPARVWRGVAYANFHDGVDISGGWGVDVVAPARARVVFVGMMGDGAEIVVLAHDDGFVSLYAHLDASTRPPTVRAGDEVAAGQRIGAVGMTGMTTGPHLHWVVWRHGDLVDPLSLLGR
jgi:murein DD-endopeptidase MepM/ murein hydrolase activator NlpD